MDEAKHRNDEIREQLSNNEHFRQISHLEEKLADLTEEVDRTQQIYDEIKKVNEQQQKKKKTTEFKVKTKKLFILHIISGI